jgi:murein DD-endopeptidase MepM/ murein hydrolase activator NlpD
MIAHKINGEQYTTLFAHMLDDSIKVSVGQKIEAGTPLGKMGSTGMSTGKHLHWELHKGKKYEWSATGLNFIEPVAFFDALAKLEAVKGTAKNETPVDAPAAPAPVHGKVDKNGAMAYGGKLLKQGEPQTPAVVYLQNKLGVSPNGPFGPKTHAAVVDFQKKHKLTADGVVGPLTWSKLG